MSKNRFTGNLIVDILKLCQRTFPPSVDHIPAVEAGGSLNLARHNDGRVERVAGVPFQWQLLPRTDEDRRDEAAAEAAGDGGYVPSGIADRRQADCDQKGDSSWVLVEESMWR